MCRKIRSFISIVSVKPHSGFTLTELLIALAILGVIATFTIPKVLNAQQDQAWNSAGKEAAAVVSQIVQSYKIENSGSLNLKLTESNITPYLNYVYRQTSGLVDNIHNAGSFTCNPFDHLCYIMHNGGIIWTDTDYYLREADGALAAVPFYFDPDGIYSGNPTGPGKSVQLWIYINGRLTTRGGIESNTIHRVNDTTTNLVNPDSNADPPWFSW